MNLAASYEMRFGGPGSGCRGPNCGRPATGRGVKQSFKTASGATYTIFKPSRKGMPKGQHSVKDVMQKADRLKGQYRTTLADVKGRDPKRLASVYDAKYGRGDVYQGHGTTVFVHRDYSKNRVVVHEIPHDELNKSATAHAFKFRNFGQAAGFLNKRYGIRQKLPKPDALQSAGEAKSWAQDLLTHCDPEQIEKLFETVYAKHQQAFSIESVDKDKAIVVLADGKRVQVKW